MNSQIQFMNQELWWVAILFAFLLVLLFVWKEWKGEFNTRFLIHSLLGFLAIVALLFLYLRPALLSEVSGKALLLTDGYSISQLDSIKNKEKSIQTIVYTPGLDFSKSLDSVTEVIVLGNGLPSFDFWQLKDMSTTYIMGATPTGVVKLKYENQLRIGNKLLLNGLYNRPISGNRLVLETASGEGLDSIVLKGDKEQSFSLKSNLKAKGKFVFQLSEKDSTGIVKHSDPVPVEVLGKAQLRIFISNRFPSFETKYLKNFLAEEGHELVVRSQITKGRYKFEYFNTARSPVYGFRKNNLKNFDLLILDTDTYLSLSKSDKDVLLKLIKDTGLGIFVQPNESLFRSTNAIVNFRVERDARQKNIKIENGIVETYPYRFQNMNLSGIALQNHSYALVVGKGKLTTTFLSNTYQLVLDGKTDAYSNIWATIITATAKAQEASGIFEVVKPFSFIHQPKLFTLRTDISKPTVTVNNEYNIPLIKNTVLEDRWAGKTYPNRKGWNSLQLISDTNVVNNYYVMDTIYWKSLIGMNTIRENSRFFGSTKRAQVEKRLPVELSLWWFLAIFVCCMGYLWLFPKLKA